MQREQAIKILKIIVFIGIYGGLLMPLMFIPVVIFPFVFSKLIFFQVLIGLTFPAYLALAWACPEHRPRKSILYFAFVAYFLALLLSVIFAADPLRAWWGNQERMNGLFTLLHLFAWLTMTVSLVKTWPQWRNVLNYLTVLGAFMGIVALLQKPFPNLLLFPAGPRVGGLLDNPIYQGAYQLFILFFIVLLWFKTKSRGWKTWYVIVAIISTAAMFAAGSRGPFMGLMFGAVISAISVGVMYKNTKVRAALFGSIGLAAVLYLAIVTVGVKTAAFQSLQVSYPTATRIFSLQTGTAGRFIAWDIAWQSFLERPLTGYGLDNFHIAFNKYYNPNSLRSGYYETWFDRAHNTVMDVFSMTGIIGFLTFLAVWIGLYYTIINARRKKYLDIPTTAVLMGLPAGYFLQNVFVFDHPAAFSMSYLLYALVICSGFAVFAGKEEKVVTAGKNKPVPWVAYGAIQAGFLLLVYLTSIMPFYASTLVIKSNKEFSRGNMPKMVELANRAAGIQTPYLDEQYFINSRNLISLASSGNLSRWPEWRAFFDMTQSIYDRFYASHGNNAHTGYIHASMLSAVGLASQDQEIVNLAEQRFRSAIELSPKRQQLFFSLAELLRATGRYDEALQLYMQAGNFDDQIGEPWWYVAVTYYFDKKQPEEAAQYFARSQSVAHPHRLKSAQDAYLVAQSYVLLEDAEALKQLIILLPTMPAAQPDVYVQIAKACQDLDLLAERNLILNAVAQMDPATKAKFLPLLQGDVQTMEESLFLYEVEQESKQQAQQATTTEPVPAYTGPRR
jgi:O-antigen ligase/tetratricopeptide (TPR) repeat protein